METVKQLHHRLVLDSSDPCNVINLTTSYPPYNRIRLCLHSGLVLGHLAWLSIEIVATKNTIETHLFKNVIEKGEVLKSRGLAQFKKVYLFAFPNSLFCLKLVL